MIIGTGCDLVEVARIKKALEQQGFADRVYSKAEQAYCTTSAGGFKYESFAARFAAKEAVLKALGTGLRGGELVEVETLNDELGKPEVHLSGYFQNLASQKGVRRIHLTLSHTRGQAMAFAVLED
jgi:holo-[acyl-carrier protein] synthase